MGLRGVISGPRAKLYLRGLMLDGKRKSTQPMAAGSGPITSNCSSSTSTWDYVDVRRRSRHGGENGNRFPIDATWAPANRGLQALARLRLARPSAQTHAWTPTTLTAIGLWTRSSAGVGRPVRLPAGVDDARTALPRRGPSSR